MAAFLFCSKVLNGFDFKNKAVVREKETIKTALLTSVYFSCSIEICPLRKMDNRIDSFFQNFECCIGSFLGNSFRHNF